ncbi:hypothetical protein [Chenggangzhangella methanolivorans]|uniref:hypothetical protein n=1 Tax=Chenggangzhangella methanolivorans TaxID=1437009 RepID=UPI003D17D7AE
MATPENALRVIGVVSAAIGVAIVWLVRGLGSAGSRRGLAFTSLRFFPASRLREVRRRAPGGVPRGRRARPRLPHGGAQLRCTDRRSPRRSSVSRPRTRSWRTSTPTISASPRPSMRAAWDGHSGSLRPLNMAGSASTQA